MSTQTPIKGVKGFDKDLKCRAGMPEEFQYELGKEYSMDKKPSACNHGFHFCENPFDVLNYYPLRDGNRFAEVESAGDIDTHREDSKVSTNKIKIGLELNLKSLIQFGVKFIFSKVQSSTETTATTGNYANAATTGESANAATTGESANAATTGNYANAATTGNYANAATTGNYANAATTGSESIAAGIGINNKAKGAIGCWIVLSEWIQDKSYRWKIKGVKTAIVDGKKIKADTWYSLEGGKFIEKQ